MEEEEEEAEEEEEVAEEEEEEWRGEVYTIREDSPYKGLNAANRMLLIATRGTKCATFSNNYHTIVSQPSPQTSTAEHNR